MIALGRLGWSLRRIEEATGVRRETAGGYLRSAGIALRTPGGWGRKGPSIAAISVTTGLAGSNPANEVITGFSDSRADVATEIPFNKHPVDKKERANPKHSKYCHFPTLADISGLNPSETHRDSIEFGHIQKVLSPQRR